MLPVVIGKPDLCRAFSPVPFCRCGPAQTPQPRQILPAGAHLKPFGFKTLRSLQDRTPIGRSVIGHLLKSCRAMVPQRRRKSKYYFRLIFALIPLKLSAVIPSLPRAGERSPQSEEISLLAGLSFYRTAQTSSPRESDGSTEAESRYFLAVAFAAASTGVAVRR